MNEVELPASSSSSSASASKTMRPPSSFSGPPIEEWRYTIPLAPAVPPARAATSSAPNAVPPRVAPVNRAPEPMPEPLFPLAHSEPVFGAITLGNDFVPEYFCRWSYHRMSWPPASWPAFRFTTYLSASQCLSSVSLQGLSRQQHFRRR